MRFVLIHGGFHGAWCWDRTIPELRRLGHEAVAIDLPGHGIRRDERSTLADRRDAILAVVKKGDVLVGHSGGGYDITLAADVAPDLVGHLIYLAAGLPLEGKPVLAATGGEAASASAGGKTVVRLNAAGSGMAQFVRPNARGRMECVDFAAARDYFYNDVDDETAVWAFARLSPAPLEFLVEPVSVPTFWKANLPRSYILCTQDKTAMRFQAPVFADRLGVVPLTLEASHSPFLSQPSTLADLFVRATATVPIAPPRPD